MFMERWRFFILEFDSGGVVGFVRVLVASDAIVHQSLWKSIFCDVEKISVQLGWNSVDMSWSRYYTDKVLEHKYYRGTANSVFYECR